MSHASREEAHPVEAVEWQTLDRTISLIYDAALHEQLWTEAIESICAACGARRGSIVYHTRVGDGISIIGHCDWPTAPDRLPAIPHVEGDIVTPREDRGHTERPRYVMVAGVQQGRRSCVSVLFEAESALDATARMRLLAVIPHLRRALQLSQKDRAAWQEIGALRLALNSAPIPAFVIGIDGTIHARNEAGADLLRHGPALLVSGGRIQARRRSENEALQQAIATAAAWSPSDTKGPPGLLHLRSRQGYPALSLMFAPLRTQWPDLDPVIVLLVSDLVSPRMLEPTLLGQQFFFTAAESEVAASLAEGRGLAEIASASGISLGTVRVHLKHLLAKTATHSQAQLVSVLWHSLGTFRAEAQPTSRRKRRRTPGKPPR